MAHDSDMSEEEVTRLLPQRYRQRDVSFWAVVALVCAGTAMIMANIGPALPPGLMAGLHASRLEGGNVTAMRSTVRELEREVAGLRQENDRMVAMLTLADRGRGDITRRVGALEASIPNLLEAIPAGVPIDRSATTASIGARDTQTEEVEGGRVTYSVEPMPLQPHQPFSLPAALAPEDGTEAEAAPAAESNAAPQLARVSTDDYGIAIGKPVPLQETFIAWSDMKSKIGALLLDLEPVLTSEGADRYHLVAGPIPELAEAETLCNHIGRTGTSCVSVPYAGYAMPQ